MSNSQKEAKDIGAAIQLFEKGPWSERRYYEKEFAENRQVSVNGFQFERGNMVWYVWKPTDIGKNPEYKGEPLLKIVPRHNVLDIEKLLSAQAWLYI